MAHYIESPERTALGTASPSVFVAGGITGCWNWQEHASMLLVLNGITAVNPRREDFPMGDPNAAEAQIEWEFDFLQAVDGIIFWFTADTLQPITLFELGKWITRDKPIAVGCDAGYARLQDVQIQTGLERPGFIVHDNIDDVIQDIKQQLRAGHEKVS
jgi:hypothetical protein